MEKKNTKVKKRMHAKTKVLLVSLLFIIFIFTGIWSYQYNIYLDFTEKENVAQAELDRELAITNNLEKELKYQDTDAFIESIARKELNMIKPNEMIIINKALKK